MDSLQKRNFTIHIFSFLPTFLRIPRVLMLIPHVRLLSEQRGAIQYFRGMQNRKEVEKQAVLRNLHQSVFDLLRNPLAVLKNLSYPAYCMVFLYQADQNTVIHLKFTYKLFCDLSQYRFHIFGGLRHMFAWSCHNSFERTGIYHFLT